MRKHTLGDIPVDVDYPRKNVLLLKMWTQRGDHL